MDSGDFGYDVYLNGRKIKDCISADSESGDIEVYRKYNDGEFIINDAGTEIERETLKGRVRIKRWEHLQ